MDKIDIIIMAAGKGSRLLPLTKDKPKCMVEVNSKPILQHIVNNLHKSKIKVNKLIVVVGYKENVVIDYIINNSLGYYTEIVTQDKLDGTANAIYICKNYIDSDNFIVLSGDIIYEPIEIKMLSEYPNSILFTETDENLYEYGTLDLVGKGMFFYVKNINEKSTNPTSNRINCGAYNFDKRVFDYIKKTPYDERFNEKIITNTINLMVSDGVRFKSLYIPELNEITRIEDIKKVERCLW